MLLSNVEATLRLCIIEWNLECFRAICFFLTSAYFTRRYYANLLRVNVNEVEQVEVYLCGHYLL